MQTTKPVRLSVDFTGIGKGRYNDTRAGFEIGGKINRKDFGLTFNILTETGGLIVGVKVKLHFDTEILLQTRLNAGVSLPKQLQQKTIL